MKTKILASLVAASMMAFAGSALAGDWYAAGSVGSSSVDVSKTDLDGQMVSAGFTGVSSSLDKNDTAYKLQLGYQFNPNFALEGGYVDLGKAKYSVSYTGPVAGSGQAEISAKGWNVNAVGIIPLSNDFSVLGKVGLIDAKVEISGPAGSVSDTSWKATWGVGGAYNFSKTMAVRLEYDRYSKLGNNNTTGEGDVDLWSVGLVYKF